MPVSTCWTRQRRARAVRVLDELHEDVVPDFEVALAVAPGGAIGRAAAVLGSAVEVDLGVWSVWPGGADRAPPVVVEAADALIRDADLVAPDAQRVLVVGMDGRVEAVAGDAKRLGHELPRPPQRFPLEVVADREIAQHEEEREVALVADLVDVDGAEALLHRHHPLRRRLLQTQKVGRHLLHAGGGQQHGRVVVRHQRRRRHLAVAALHEEFDETAPHLLAGHRRGHLAGSGHGSSDPLSLWAMGYGLWATGYEPTAGSVCSIPPHRRLSTNLKLIAHSP